MQGTLKVRIFCAIQQSLPAVAITRVMGFFAGVRLSWFKNCLIKSFASAFNCNMDEALEPDHRRYGTFNAFFTRALKSDARPITEEENSLCCPADGVISQLGPIEEGYCLQAKNHRFSIVSLLGGNDERAAPFKDGRFLTVYLSPKDYHRVHMPFDGTLRETVYIPGRLFSVNHSAAAGIPNLFARNERLVALFDCEFGPMAVVFVGAMIVGGVETVWGHEHPPRSHDIHVRQFSSPETQNTDDASKQTREKTQFIKGDELGRFKLGSTAIVLLPNECAEWASSLSAGHPVRMGEAIGHVAGA